jgi:hypothetical protein
MPLPATQHSAARPICPECGDPAGVTGLWPLEDAAGDRKRACWPCAEALHSDCGYRVLYEEAA